MVKRKGQLLEVGVLLLVICALVILAPMALKVFGISIGSPTAASVSQQIQSGSTEVANACPDTKVGTLRFLAKSPFPNTYYQPPVTYVWKYTSPDAKAGITLSSSTGSSNSESYSSNLTSIGCPSVGDLIVLGGSNSTGGYFSGVSMVGSDAIKRVDIPNSTALRMFVYDSSFANKTQIMDGVASATTGGFGVTTVSTAMSTNGRTSWIVKMLPAGGYVYGNYQKNELILAFDYDSTIFSSASGVTVSGINGVTEIDTNSYGIKDKEKVFKIPALVGGNLLGWTGLSGEQNLNVVLSADLGDPTTDVLMYVYQPGWFMDTDGTYKYGVFDSASTQKVGGMNNVTFDLS